MAENCPPDHKLEFLLAFDGRAVGMTLRLDKAGALPTCPQLQQQLEAAGLVRMKSIGRRKAPSAAIKKIVVEIDPFSENDRLRVA